jgi:hypothetical protein
MRIFTNYPLAQRVSFQKTKKKMLGAGLLTALTIQSVSDASRYFPQSYHFFK